MPSRSIRLAVLFVCAAVVAAPAQPGRPQDQQPPTFRAGTTLVSVDVFPRVDGTIVDDLSAADFQVLEDGVPQAVETFEFVRIAQNPADESRRDPTSLADSTRQAADPRNRLFVIYLDLYHATIGGSVQARGPLLDFLARTIGPTDLFAVLTPETPISRLTFGRQIDGLERALSSTGSATWGLADRMPTPENAAEQELFDCFQRLVPGADAQDIRRVLTRHRDDVLFTSLEGMVLQLGALRDERKHVIFFTGAFVPDRPRPDLVEGGTGRIPTVGVGPTGRLTTGADPGVIDHARCDALLGRLASIDFEDRYRDLLRAAEAANVAFYPIDTAGLRVESNVAGLQTLRLLAEATNGTAVLNTNDIGGELTAIANEVSAYYLLGYYSTNTEPDGRYRRIQVRVDRPGVDVSARHGYRAPTAEQWAAREAAAAAGPPVRSPALDALDELGRLRPDIPLYLRVTPRPDHVDVAAELATRELERGVWSDGADVEVELRGPDGSTTASGHIDANAGGTLVPVDWTGGGGPWTVRARVSGGGSSHTADATLDARPDASAVGPPTIYRAAPSPRAPLRPVAAFLFRRTERLRIEWPTIEAPAGFDVQLLNRSGDPLPVDLTLSRQETSAGPALVLDLSLSPFAEGDYIVELIGDAAAGAAERDRYVAFRLDR